MKYRRTYVSSYFGDSNQRKAVISRDDYHWIIDRYDNNKFDSTVLAKHKNRAEDLAEDWVEEV